MAATKQTVLGEIRSSTNNAFTTYTIECSLEKPCIINSTILDQQGVTIWEQNSMHPIGKSQIILELPSLNRGKYNCWIKIDGKMYRRPIHISSKSKKGLINSFMSHFS